MPGRAAVEAPGWDDVGQDDVGQDDEGLGEDGWAEDGWAEDAGEVAAGRGSAQVRAGGASASARVGVPSDGGSGEHPRVRAAAGSAPAEAGGAVGGLKGARSELRRQMRAKRRLRVLTLVSVSVLVLGLLPLIFGIRSAMRDPVFTSLDSLSVPAWADAQPEDKTSGSRWCFMDCRFWERVVQSDKSFDETGTAYVSALTDAGWQRRDGECTDQPLAEGTKYSCWTRDEFNLDLYVGLPQCAVDAVAAQDPDALPSVGPDGVVETADPSTCVGSTVSIKVQNAATDERGWPGSGLDPSLVGETPDPVLTNEPLLEPTPTPS
ncbi:hypothetical protein [Actinoplanes sp. NPDC051494]|uniref:hypothetical protein n=1 Tax=Actinoplanes sp. NPDC051494 TaxID=3363907 RepID=UPI00379CCA7D